MAKKKKKKINIKNKSKETKTGYVEVKKSFRERVKLFFTKENLKKVFSKRRIETGIFVLAVIVAGYFANSYIKLHLNEKTSVILSERSHYKDFIYDKEAYFDGEGIKPGIYKAFAKGSFGYVQLENKNRESALPDLNIVGNATFNKSGYVDIKKGDTVKLDGCYLVPLDKAAATGTVGEYFMGNNVYLVGKDMKAGKYKVTFMTDEEKDQVESVSSMIMSKRIRDEIKKSRKLKTTSVDIWDSLTADNPVASKSDFRETEITVKDGQYVELDNCKAEFIK